MSRWIPTDDLGLESDDDLALDIAGEAKQGHSPVYMMSMRVLEFIAPDKAEALKALNREEEVEG